MGQPPYPTVPTDLMLQIVYGKYQIAYKIMQSTSAEIENKDKVVNNYNKRISIDRRRTEAYYLEEA